MEEIWKEIDGFDFYKFSNYGRIKSYYKNMERYLKYTTNVHGYFKVSLFENGVRRSFLVHRLVLTAFIGKPKGNQQTNHKNGIRNDNHLDNLEWCTPSENVLHSFRVLHKVPYLLGKFGVLHKTSVKVNQLSMDGEFVKSWDSMSDAMREIKVDQASIGKVCMGKANMAGGFKWEYVNKQLKNKQYAKKFLSV